MQDTFNEAALAIFSDNIDSFAQILQATPAVALHKAENGHPTLLQMVACEEPHVPDARAVAQLLLDAGAATTWALISAAGCNAPQTLTTILDHGVAVDADNPWTPLDEALYWNNPDIVAMLLDRGASLGRLRRAAGIGSIELLESFFLGSIIDVSAGPVAAPFADTVDEDTKNDPGSIVDHAFVMAVNCGRKEAAQWLLGRGARINTPPPGLPLERHRASRRDLARRCRSHALASRVRR